jgi:hypothetical protein
MAVCVMVHSYRLVKVDRHFSESYTFDNHDDADDRDNKHFRNVDKFVRD